MDPTYSPRMLMAQVRDTLRISLSRHYHLEQYDLYFAPSLHVARVVLSQLFLRQEQARNQTRYATHFPVTELSVLPAIPLMAGNITLVPHVDLINGKVRPLSDCQKEGVTDASESFASVLHHQVINETRLFISRLDRHADLGGDLVLIALRTQDFSTLVRSELRLFEQGLALQHSVDTALKRMEDPQWRPYNMATVDNITLNAPRLMHSCHQPGLPFAVFSSSPELIASLNGQSDVCLWPHQGKFQLYASMRTHGKKSVNLTQQLGKRLQSLIATGVKSEKHFPCR